MAEQSLTAVVTDKRKIEMRHFDVPKPSAADAILKVEPCGICGSDYHYYTEGTIGLTNPRRRFSATKWLVA